MGDNATPRLTITLSHVRDLTLAHGEGWAYPHVSRLLRLIEEIGAGMDYNQEVVVYAAYLHDWGAFPKYMRPGIQAAVRSRQVAASEILPYTVLSEETRNAILEAIETHDYRSSRTPTTLEGRLLREADMLDSLGAIGAARTFAGGPKDLKKGVDRLHTRVTRMLDKFSLPRARQMAQERLTFLELFLGHLQEESYGYL